MKSVWLVLILNQARSKADFVCNYLQLSCLDVCFADTLPHNLQRGVDNDDNTGNQDDGDNDKDSDNDEDEVFKTLCRCLAAPDFKEGIRCNLLEKDKGLKPLWSPSTLKQVKNIF